MDTLIGTLLGVVIGGCPLILLGVGVLIGWWIISGKPAADARALQAKFHQLGTVAGKTRAEIEKVVGPAKSWVAIGDGRFTYSWNTQKYYVTLVFKGDICEGIQNEISV
jgi:hypothetical protein